MNTPSSPISEWLRAQRIKRGLSLRQLSRITGIGNTTISYLELQAHSIKLNDFVAVCHAFKLKPAKVIIELGL